MMGEPAIDYVYFMQAGQDGPIKTRQIGIAPNYWIGDDGSVWTRLPVAWPESELTEWRQRKLTLEKNGYIRIDLYRNGCAIRQLVHRLVLTAFVGPCPEGMEACHLNGVRSDNRLVNLRWDTRKANRRDMDVHGTLPRGENHGHSRLTNEDVRNIRRLFDRGFSQRAIARHLNLPRTTLRRVIDGTTWSHVLRAGSAKQQVKKIS